MENKFFMIYINWFFFLLLIQRPKKSSQNNKGFMSSHTGTYLLQILGHMQYIVALVFFYSLIVK